MSWHGQHGWADGCDVRDLRNLKTITTLELSMSYVGAFGVDADETMEWWKRDVELRRVTVSYRSRSKAMPDTLEWRERESRSFTISSLST